MTKLCVDTSDPGLEQCWTFSPLKGFFYELIIKQPAPQHQMSTGPSFFSALRGALTLLRSMHDSWIASQARNDGKNIGAATLGCVGAISAAAFKNVSEQTGMVPYFFCFLQSVFVLK